jgi:hypothetical protein
MEPVLTMRALLVIEGNPTSASTTITRDEEQAIADNE